MFLGFRGIVLRLIKYHITTKVCLLLYPRNNSNFHLDPPRHNTCLRLLGNSLTPLHIINGKVLEGEAGIFGSDPSSGFYTTFRAKALLFAHSLNLACFAAVEVHMEGNYRAGVGCVGRESEEVVFYDRRTRTRYPHKNIFVIYQTCQFDIQVRTFGFSSYLHTPGVHPPSPYPHPNLTPPSAPYTPFHAAYPILSFAKRMKTWMSIARPQVLPGVG
ncbi:hypothetical protein C8R48DRAFT_781931 [Suillus tomentosus]|nr:hypothetical protein C8R48DRAFT_781931 [Suillus tomentosus]